jgi:hypothetical protein
MLPAGGASLNIGEEEGDSSGWQRNQAILPALGERCVTIIAGYAVMKNEECKIKNEELRQPG